MTDRIRARQFHAAEGAEAWRVLPEGAYAFFRSDSFIASVKRLTRSGFSPISCFDVKYMATQRSGAVST